MAIVVANRVKDLEEPMVGNDAWHQLIATVSGSVDFGIYAQEG